jgi:putative FmdB family regulatory protein
MPLYEYHCSLCGVLEKLMKFEDSTIKIIKCDCGRPAERIPSDSSFELVGGGWAGSGYSKGV